MKLSMRIAFCAVGCVSWLTLSGCETTKPTGVSSKRNGDWLDFYDAQNRWIGGANVKAFEGGYDCGEESARRHELEQIEQYHETRR